MAEAQDGLHLEAEPWAGPMGERWLAHLDPFESMMVDVGDAGIAAAGFQPGERVIDIGCGGGKDDDPQRNTRMTGRGTCSRPKTRAPWRYGNRSDIWRSGRAALNAVLQCTSSILWRFRNPFATLRRQTPPLPC